MACNIISKTSQRLINTRCISRIDYKTCTTKKPEDKSQNHLQKSEKSFYPEEEEVTKDSLQWRSPWHEKGEWYSKLKVFSSDHNNVDATRFLQSPIDLWPSTLLRWYRRRQEEIEKALQMYIPERNAILGNELAAAHFIVHRGGAVKFFGEPEWVKKKDDEYDLPKFFVANMMVQAIDCSGVNLYYEGLENFRSLAKIEWLKLKGCRNMDDWCMDRISGSLLSLKYLDIRECENITERGIGALYRTTKLETLLVDNLTKNKSLELTCLMLQELMPKLVVKSHD